MLIIILILSLKKPYYLTLWSLFLIGLFLIIILHHYCFTKSLFFDPKPQKTLLFDPLFKKSRIILNKLHQYCFDKVSFFDHFMFDHYFWWFTFLFFGDSLCPLDHCLFDHYFDHYYLITYYLIINRLIIIFESSNFWIDSILNRIIFDPYFWSFLFEHYRTIRIFGGLCFDHFCSPPYFWSLTKSIIRIESFLILIFDHFCLIIIFDHYFRSLFWSLFLILIFESIEPSIIIFESA